MVPGMQLEVGQLGRVPYDDALALQERLTDRRAAGGPDVLLLLEHPPVYTLGRGADERHLGGAAGGAVPIRRVGRGGEVTFHGPGQLVGYPIVDLRAHRIDVHWYLRRLEEVLITALADVGVVAGRVDGRTGVWVDGRRKIASIGIGVRHWITRHGFALNVGPDLDGFTPITPCGLEGVAMTSVAREGGPADAEAMAPLVRARFVELFGYAGWTAMERVAA